MKLIITLVLMAFGLTIFTSGQNARPAQDKNGKTVSRQATAVPISLKFPDQVIQTISKRQTINLTNTTDKPIGITRVVMSDQQAGDFEIDYNYDYGECPDSDLVIEAGKGCYIGVIFYPIVEGERSTSLLITYDDADHPQKISLRGTGIKANDAKSVGPVLNQNDRH